MDVTLTLPGGETIVNGIDRRLLDETRADIVKRGHPLVTIISRMAFGPFSIEKPGSAVLELTTDKVKRVIGALTYVEEGGSS